MEPRAASIAARIDHIKQLTDDYRSPTPPAPKSVKIELTARCDFQCSFCASHTRPREKRDMPRKFYERIVKEMRGLGVEQLGVFYLGESFLCDWLPEAIRYAKKECGYPYVFLTTNGLLASPDRLRECMLAGLDSLKFSLNFCGPAQFHKITGGSNDEYRTVINNLKDARWIREYVEVATGHRCGLYASSMLYDEKQPERMKAVLAEILPHVDEHYWLPLYGHSASADDIRDGKIGTGVARKPLPCWPLFTEGHITCDGRLSACCLDHSVRYSMGNLHRMSFLQAWRSRSFRGLREAHLKENVSGTACEKCIAYK